MDTVPVEEKRGYPIRVVSKKTGLSVHVIRAWEKRYGAVTPGRTARGQRLYSTADIERLASLAAAVKGGWNIGSVARLPKEELDKVVEEAVSAPVIPLARSAAADRAERILDSCMEAVKNLDVSALRNEIFRGSVELGETALLDEVIVPLMERIGEAWRAGALRVFHEHTASVVLRTYLEGLIASAETSPLSPCATAAALSGEHHELGALAASAAASIMGWRVRYLGPNTPADEIVGAAEQTGSRAVLISVSFVYDGHRTPEEVSRIRRFLPERCLLVLGGDAAMQNRAALSFPGVEIVDDLMSLRRLLDGFGRDGSGPTPGSAAPKGTGKADT
jgi:DNA-binding transcriptional MerR regulator/methylmalonyl-CoA mutase cobalamin-binding subunit